MRNGPPRHRFVRDVECVSQGYYGFAPGPRRGVPKRQQPSYLQAPWLAWGRLGPNNRLANPHAARRTHTLCPTPRHPLGWPLAGHALRQKRRSAPWQTGIMPGLSGSFCHQRHGCGRSASWKSQDTLHGPGRCIACDLAGRDGARRPMATRTVHASNKCGRLRCSALKAPGSGLGGHGRRRVI